MDALGRFYTSGDWTVRPGKEAEFIAAWRKFAEWTSVNQPGAGDGRLLQDPEHPSMFLSFGPWEQVEHIQEWRGRPEFAAFVARARELCEDIRPRTLRLVVHVPAR